MRCVVIWTIWLARNEVVFKKKVWRIEEVFELIKLRSFHWVKAVDFEFGYSFADWCDNPRKLNRMVRIPSGGPRSSVEWLPPVVGSHKFNVDGSAWGKLDLAGCGGVLRDDMGNTIGMFYGPLGIKESNEAIRHALRLLVKTDWMGSKELTIESDSTVAVAWAKGEGGRPWKLWKISNEIDLCVDFLKKVNFVKIFREANGFADSLAKIGVLKSSFYF